MKKLFYEDTHILDFTAAITDSYPDPNGLGTWLILDQTAFFPEEGGQAADKGTINGLPVLDVQIKGDIIRHLVQTPSALEPAADHTASSNFLPGQIVTGHVDWEQRFDFMQQHSGEHIVSGLLHSHFGFRNVGFHLGATEVTMDFDQSISLEMLREIETEANRIVWQNLPVFCTFPEKDQLTSMDYRSKIEIEGPVRIVEIPGVDRCACCAPHVEHTGEIGMIKIINAQNHRGGVRINILCGGRALADYTAKQNSSSAISSLLSVKQDALTDGVKKLQEDIVAQKQQINQLAEQLRQARIVALPDCSIQPNPLLFVQIDNPIAIRNAVNRLSEIYPGYCSIFNGCDETGYQFIIGSSSKDCRQLATQLRTSLGAKCGGTAPMIQGSVQESQFTLESFFARL